jgi:hypothetical protein
MEVNFVDKSGREVPFADGGKLVKVLGFGDALSVLFTSSAFAPEDALGSLAALREKGPVAVRMRYEKEAGKWVVGVSLGPRSIEVELVPYVDTLGETKWKAVVRLPCEWLPAMSALVDALDALAERLEGEVQALRREIEQLRERLSEAQPKPRPEPPIDAASARRIARALRDLADAVEEPFEVLEEEEEEEEEW